MALFILIGFIKINYSNEDFFKRLFYFKIGKPAFIIVIIGFVLIFTLDSLKNKLIRNEIIEFANKQNINAKINGKIDLCFKPVEFKKIQSEDDRNIGKDKIEILIISKTETYPLTLLRSNNDKYTYWVFSSKYYSTVKNCIGQLSTKSLDKY